MKTQQYPATFISIILIIAAASTPPSPLFATQPGSTRLEQEQKYIAILQSDAKLFDKARACQQLALIGTKNAVPVLASLLDNETLGDYARFALEPIEDAGVDEAFRKALDKLQGKSLAGVINSIGARHDAKAVPGLSKLARDPASGVADQAIAALGRIGTDQAIDTIVHVLATGSANLRIAAADACLAAAERRLEQNKPKEAVELYDTVRIADLPGHIRTAATYGAILARAGEGTSLLIEQLKSDDPSMVEIALRAARELPGPRVTKALVAELNKSEPAVQALLIKVLVDREDPSAYESIKGLASSSSPAVRIESLKVLGRLGDASAVPVLLKAATAGNEEATIAAAALRTLEGDDVDQAIVKGMKAAKDKLRSQLIGILADRNCTTATAALLSEAASQDDTVATAAFKALTSLAAPKDLPALVNLLVGVKNQQVRIHAENAVVAAAAKIDDQNKRADEILSSLTSIGRVASRSSLLRVLGRIANGKAFEALQNAADESNDEIRDTAIRALAAWPDSKALDTLSTVSQETSNNTHRVLALRGYVRLLGLDTKLPQKEKAERYELAMNTAAGTDEKKLVLAGLANVAHPDVLKIILDYTGQPLVKDEAILAAIKVAQAVAGARPEQAKAAAMKINNETTNQQIRRQAQALIATIDRFDDFIVSWRVAGPYSQDNRNHSQLFGIAFPPETQPDNVKWSLVPAATDAKRPWILDLLKLYPGDSQVAYVKTWIKSEKSRQVVLEAGSDDGIKAWLNGKLVHANNVPRAAIPGTDKANITLNQGWNKLMLKITQNNGPWEFCMRIRNAEGAKVEGIEIDCLYEEHEPVAEQDATSIFDGKTFSGWEGNLDFFRIEDGAVVGGTLKEGIPRNEFLCAQKEYDDFELRLKVRLLGDPASANAGIQIRSRRIPNHNEMIGYQADMGQHYWGCLYDESRRRKVLASVDRAQLDKVLKVGQWNDYVIRCEGKRIRLWINSYPTVDYTEADDSIEQTGLIGLQIHSGPPSEAWYKDITVKEL